MLKVKKRLRRADFVVVGLTAFLFFMPPGNSFFLPFSLPVSSLLFSAEPTEPPKLAESATSTTPVKPEEKPYDGQKAFMEVLSIVQKNYVEPLSDKTIVNGALHGMISGLDPHSSYMEPDAFKESKIQTKGEFGGLGMEVESKEGKVVVVSPIDGSPAERAGILPGDIILEVDDKPLDKKKGALMDAVKRIRGVIGTNVKVAIQREQGKEPLKFDLVREKIRLESVKSKVLSDEMGYVRITQFQARTGLDLAKVISGFKVANVHSLILDLRNNPGGLLTTSVAVAEQFLKEGQVVVSVNGRDGKKDEWLAHVPHANGGQVSITLNGKKDVVEQAKGWLDIPMVILVNKGTGSGAEVVSGALQDQRRAVIMGTQTFGKGTVQTTLPLPDGSAVRLTTAKYYLPSGRTIHGVGVTPDIAVDPGAMKSLFKMEELKEVTEDAAKSSPDSKAGEQEKQGSALPKTEEKTEAMKKADQEVQLLEKDVQLKRAIDLLKGLRIFNKSIP